MHPIYQRGPDGFPVGADEYLRESYGQIPAAAKFQHPKGGVEKPLEVHGWQWTETFRRWTALVTFPDGHYCFTYPVHGT